MLADCSMNYPESIGTRETDTQFEGSGGGTALINNTTNNITQGGSGGGIIWISAANRARF